LSPKIAPITKGIATISGIPPPVRLGFCPKIAPITKGIAT